MSNTDVVLSELLMGLQSLGFGTDGEINGADAVEAISDLYNDAITRLCQVPRVDSIAAPVVVVEMNGGAIHRVRSNQEVRVVLLDEDTETDEPEHIRDVNGQDFYVHNFWLSHGEVGVIDPEFIHGVLCQVDPNESAQTLQVPATESKVDDGSLPACLEALGPKERGQIQMDLSNNEVSTNEELIELWTKECGIPKEAAEAAIKYRTEFFLDPLYEMFPYASISLCG